MRSPSETSECLAQRHPIRRQELIISQFEDIDAVEKNAAELQDAVDKLSELRRIRGGSGKVKEYIRKWYRASYPFARMFISVAKEAAAVLSPELVEQGTERIGRVLWRASRPHGGAPKRNDYL